MKIGWNLKIITLYLGFLVFLLSMVILSINQKIDLVSEDYYEQELHFQNKINKMYHSNQLQEPLTWNVMQGKLILKFPQQFKNQNIVGAINFYRPSDVQMDTSFTFHTDSILTQNIITQNLKKGIYNIQINWNTNNVDFYNEGTIVVY